jgi:hypothetical protein
MASQTKGSNKPPRRLWRSTAAILAGIVAGAGLSLGTDQVLHLLAIYPPWGQPLYDPGLNLLALAYRCVYSVAASTLAAWLAPTAPMRHALVLGAVNFLASGAGAIAAVSVGGLGPIWYPVALTLTTLPCAWLGGWAYTALRGKS